MSELAQQRLAKRYLVFTLFFSSLLTAVFCVSDVLTARTERLTNIEQSFKRLQSFYGPQLSSNLWLVQEKQLISLMEGIVENEPIDYLHVSDEENEWESGSSVVSSVRERSLVLRFVIGTDKVVVGQMYAAADSKQMNRYLANLGIVLILRNFLKSIFMVLLSFWLFQQMVHRHIERISGAIRLFEPQRAGEKLRLENSFFDRRNTELDELVLIVNEQQSELRENHLTMQTSQRDLQGAVEQRTLELQQVHAQLLAAEKMILIGHMVASVAHELRNPLGVIRNSSEFIRLILSQQSSKQGKMSRHMLEAQQRAFDRLERGVDRCDRLIGQLREYSNKRNPSLQYLDIVFWIKEYCDIEFDWPGGYSCRLLGELKLECAIDPHEMSMVVSNLLSNAVQAMAANQLCSETVVIVSVLKQGDGVSVLIEDTGGGISEGSRGAHTRAVLFY